MLIIFQIIFWASIFLILHSYVFFPILLKIIAKNKKLDFESYQPATDDLPTVSIILAVFNEEKIIEEKIKSTFKTNYPLEKIEFLIGSDNSSDKTNEIIGNLQKKYKNLHFYPFTERQGKIKIINQLAEKCKNKIIISTDAKVLFVEDTIYHLIEYFKDEKIKIVGGFLINQANSKAGIAVQENLFMNREMIIKYNEGLIWQNVIGIYGALYAIRKTDFEPVPENLLVDDFFITMKILQKGGKVIFNKKAVAYENLPQKLSEEYKRKVRIATGNFQNMKIFSRLLLNPFKPLNFCYISHKALRWLTPFLFIFILISNILLFNIFLYKISLFFIISILILPIIDTLLKKLNININILRLVTHFLSMNFALMKGFFRSLKGVSQSTWQPSQRV